MEEYVTYKFCKIISRSDGKIGKPAFSPPVTLSYLIVVFSSFFVMFNSSTIWTSTVWLSSVGSCPIAHLMVYESASPGSFMKICKQGQIYASFYLFYYHTAHQKIDCLSKAQSLTVTHKLKNSKIASLGAGC